MVSESPFSRREALTALTATTLTTAFASTHSATSHAEAAMQRSQLPGFYRFRVGEIEVTVLSDGVFTVPTRFSAENIPEDQLRGYLSALYYKPDNQVRHMNFALINTGKEVVLIDPGAGPDFRPTAGKLLSNLKASGYSPEQIDKVFITHAHPDHIWGLIDFFEGTPTFPNATYVLHEDEWAFWTADDAKTRLPKSLESFAVGAVRHLKPIAGRQTLFSKEAEIANGVFAVPTIGHTIGHSSVVVRSKGEQLLITGDAFYHPYITFEHPDWQPLLDMLPEKAVETRKSLTQMAFADRQLVLAFHFAFPGLGRVAKRNGSYHWVPANWEWDT